ncbi:conserved exported protein of unknown function [Petrocella atlantisensis]|uniref:SLH domain-containing protein n=2 Tax=Petrocella atlantisensis TaxID=2173034 RepID=A0A3P7PW35_9FIRM|nr:conserved exported protein of unknown function [Petrocella atlantisensis]
MRKTNRFVALLMALVLVFSSAMSTAVFANEDVAGTEFEVTVGKLKAVGIMEGYPDGTFKPEGEITRAEFAKIAVVALGLGDAAEVSRGVTKFPDVPSTHWATGYINLAVNRGILVGYPDGSFQPNGKLTNAEAATILVRLVGLGPVVDKQGTWPANYIGRAANEGILKGVNVASSTNALRGLTAKMLLNTIEVPLWGADGYNNDGSVTYGKLSPEQTHLTDMLNVKVYEDKEVEGYDIDDNEITIDGVPTNEIAENATFDFYDVYRNLVDVWVNDDDEIIYVAKTTTSFIDAIEVKLGTTNEVKLLGADKTYKLATSFVAANNSDVNRAGGAVADATKYDLAKVVVDDNNRVIFVDAYTFVDFMVVDSVDGDVVTDIEGTEINLEDFQIMKNGMLVDAEAAVKGDIITYNTTGDGFAEIFTKSVEGEITNIFSTGIRVGGKTYDFNKGLVADITTLYVNEDGDLATFDTDAAEQMEDEGPIAIFLDREGKMLFVTGELGDVETSKVVNILTSDISTQTLFGETSIRAVVINEEGTKVTKTIALRDLDFITLDNTKVEVGDGVGVNEVDYFELTGADLLRAYNSADALTADASFGDLSAGAVDSQFAEDSIIEFHYDTDGNVVGLGLFSGTTALTTTVKIDKDGGDKYAVVGGTSYRLMNDTLLFDITDGTSADDTIINEWSAATDVKEVALGATVYVKGGEVLYIVSGSVDALTDETDVTGLLATHKLNAAATKVTELKAWVNGVETTYVVDSIAFADLPGGVDITNGNTYILTVDDVSGKVIAIADADVVTGGIQTVNTSAREITIAGTTYKLVSGFKIVDITDGTDNGEVINLVNVKAGNTATLVLENAGSVFVELVVVTNSTADVTAPTVTQQITAASTITANGTHVLQFSEELNVASKASVKAAVDAAFTETGAATVTSAWNAAGTTLTVTIAGWAASPADDVTLAAIANQVVTDLAGNTSAALDVQQ